MYLVLSDEDSAILQLRCDNHGIRTRHKNVVVDDPHLDTITLLPSRSCVYDVLGNAHTLLRKPGPKLWDPFGGLFSGLGFKIKNTLRGKRRRFGKEELVTRVCLCVVREKGNVATGKSRGSAASKSRMHCTR
jgi:hypothetical protein